MERTPELIHGSGEAGSISDINVTPFIDVMLVLLIIFMVTAPLMMGGVRINLPKTSSMPMPRPEHPLIVSLDADSQAFVDKDPVAEGQRAETFRRLALESESGEVFVRGDGEVKYAKMMELMSELGQAGFARVTLVTNVQPGPDAGTGTEAPAPADPAATATSQAGSPAPAAMAVSPAEGPAPAATATAVSPPGSPVPTAPATSLAPTGNPAPAEAQPAQTASQ
ncbi:MAG: biopolymer transporter ExbD [Deltaproteobacteria bacterium]|jgi:biopolymer transport protein ExbD|nr:biopolymer transporter ExbD [Deltaproteobacteria bacterium]